MSQVPAVHTPTTPPELLQSLGVNYLALVGKLPSRPFCLVLMGQWAGETGAGKYEWNFNIGNEQAGGGFDFDVLNAWELRNGVRVPMKERFRAFATLDAAVLEHLTFLRTGVGGRYAPAFAKAEAGDPEGFALALHTAGYYTQVEALYAHAVRAFFDNYASLPPAAWEAAPAP